jgi:hypothetical protein
MDLVKLINDMLANRKPDEERRYIGASSIGNECSRAIWYSYNAIQGLPFDPALKTTFEVGKRLESMLLDYVEETGLRIERPGYGNDWLFCQDSEVPIFQGHLDAILHVHVDSPSVLEIKTAKNSRFQLFKKYNLKQAHYPYFLQLQSYMGMMGFQQAVILIINKDTSELHSEWVDFEEHIYRQLRIKALAISTIDCPPEKINKSPLFYLCNRCKYKDICHG